MTTEKKEGTSRRNFLKYVGGIAAVAAVGAVGYGAYESGMLGGAAPSVTLKYWKAPHGTDEQKYWAPILDKWKADHPNINIEHTVPPWTEYDAKIASALAAGTPPDVAYLPLAWVLKYNDKLLPLEDMSGAKDMEPSFSPAAWKAYQYKGHQIGIPFLLTSMMLVYNKDLFDKAGITKPPETWEELRDAAIKITDKDKGIYGYNFPVNDPWIMSLSDWFWQAGGEVLNADSTKCVLNSPENTAAMEFVNKLYSEDKVMAPGNLDDTMVTDLFWGGKLGIMHSEAFIMPVWKQTHSDFKLGAMLNLKGSEQLGFKGPGHERAGYVGTGAISIFSATQHKNEAWEFLKFVTSKDTEAAYLPNVSLFPSRTDVDVTWAKDPMGQIFVENTKYGREVIPIHPRCLEILQKVSTIPADILLNGKDVKTVMDEATAEIDKLL